jgi:peptide/nickel transport system ATP-binding protein
LNPVLKVGDQVAEPMIIHHGVGKEKALAQARAMFEHVGVPQGFMERYAFELSGGMRQRVAIAMSLVTTPAVIILDEPTSALDVLTQANIFNVLKRIKNDLEVSFMLITHDIATSSELADRVAVMYAGQIVEVSDAIRFFSEPLHPYSRALMDSVPRLRADKEPDFITGQPPSLLDPPTGCRFAERCRARFARCDQEPPMFRPEGQRTRVKCWLYA